jgi:hypothetical protein
MRYFQPLFLGLVLMFRSLVPYLQAQSSTPQAYSLTQVTQMTEASMFGGGQASNLKVYRNGSKELVELTIAPWAANPKGVHFRYLFDFQAHKAYSQDVTNNACSWMKYVSSRAPVWYDPITAVDDAARAQLAEAKQHAVGTETVNGIPALITESDTKDGKFRTWLAQQGDFPVKMTLQAPDGTVGTMMEVKQVDFSSPAASLFVPPANCSTQSQGEWSDRGVNAHAEAKIDVQGSASANSATGETHGQVTATLQQGSPSSGSQRTAAGTDSNAEDLVDDDMLQMAPSKNTCTVVFRVVGAGTMEPITSGLRVRLDNHDVTGQYREGVLGISNAPARFDLAVGAKNGASWARGLTRQCFRPETVLLLVVSPDFTQLEHHWFWVKSGKYATVPAASAVQQGAHPSQQQK